MCLFNKKNKELEMKIDFLRQELENASELFKTLTVEITTHYDLIGALYCMKGMDSEQYLQIYNEARKNRNNDFEKQIEEN